MKAISFFKRIRAQERLTPSEDRIVEHMENAFPVIALASVSTICESLIEESEEDIKNGNLISHESLKQEVLNWRPTK